MADRCGSADNLVQEQWTVVYGPFNQRQSGNIKYKGNKIKTTKYTIGTFLPKNLFEQFHRFANIYFLGIVILNWIPEINAFGKEIAMIPLLFVLSVTLIKDLFEDRMRHKSDQEVNNSKCKVYARDQDSYINKTWKDIEVGDIVKIFNDDIVPADILLLHSTDKHGIAYVSTAGLDGETNLKQKQVVLLTSQDNPNSTFCPSDLKFTVRCEKPNTQIHSFYGYVETDDGQRKPVDKNNLLLRGCLIRNTESVEGIVIYAGHQTKVMLNNSGPRYKRSKLEKDLNKDVLACVGILLFFCTIGGIGCGFWSEEHREFDKQFSPAEEHRSPAFEGFIRFWTFIIILQVIIPISLYVSVELVKLGQVYFINQDLEMFYKPTAHHSVCRATTINEDLGQIKYVFSDKTGTLTENEMVFKRFSIKGENFLHPEDPNIQLQSTRCRDIETEISLDIGAYFHSQWQEFFIGLTLCNTVVVVQNNAHSSSSNGSLVSVKSADNIGYEDVLVNEDKIIIDEGDIPEEKYNETKQRTDTGNTHSSEEFQISTNSSDNMLATHDDCTKKEPNSIIPVRINQSYHVPRETPTSNSPVHFIMPKYEVESPDEGALVKAAFLYGYQLSERTQRTITIKLPNTQTIIYQILNVLQFDSERKRMSIILKNPNGKITLYCKGADSVILNRLSHDQEILRQTTDVYLEEFARDGLRTLCIAKRDLCLEEYENWSKYHKEVELALVDRDARIAESADLIETNLELIGATGIEDKLQDGVPETIAGLREAGIRVWVLTGDKQETAINIAFSSKLLDEHMEIVVLNTRTKAECNDMLDTALHRLRSNMPSYTFAPTEQERQCKLAVVIDGTTLAFALEKPLSRKFLDLTKHCQSVVCCRAAPLQKASVVRLVRENLKVMCLGIGDGANDVSMLQVADIGIGIAGHEGMQAVMASDFVLGRFKFLKNLLLVHGHWCYDRLARMIIYFFYKNAMFIALLFWFQIFNGFSGSNAIDDISLINFNLIFTSLPPIVSGIWDQCTPARELLNNPQLYARGQQSKVYTRKIFWTTMLDSLYQSLILFFFPYLVYRDSSNGMIVVGILFHQLAVLTASLHLAIEIPNWTGIHHLILWGSIVVSYIWFLILCAVIPTSSMYWSIYEAASTLEFWLICLLAPVVALSPRYLYRSFQWCIAPTEIQLSKLSAKLAEVSSQQSLKDLGDGKYRRTASIIYPDNEQQNC